MPDKSFFWFQSLQVVATTREELSDIVDPHDEHFRGVDDALCSMTLRTNTWWVVEPVSWHPLFNLNNQDVLSNQGWISLPVPLPRIYPASAPSLEPIAAWTECLRLSHSWSPGGNLWFFQGTVSSESAHPNPQILSISSPFATKSGSPQYWPCASDYQSSDLFQASSEPPVLQFGYSRSQLLNRSWKRCECEGRSVQLPENLVRDKMRQDQVRLTWSLKCSIISININHLASVPYIVATHIDNSYLGSGRRVQ